MSEKMMKGDSVPQGAFDDAPDATVEKTKTRRGRVLIIGILAAALLAAVVADNIRVRHHLRAAEVRLEAVGAELVAAQARLEQVGAIVAPTWNPVRAWARTGKVREALK